MRWNNVTFWSGAAEVSSLLNLSCGSKAVVGLEVKRHKHLCLNYLGLNRTTGMAEIYYCQCYSPALQLLTIILDGVFQLGNKMNTRILWIWANVLLPINFKNNFSSVSVAGSRLPIAYWQTRLALDCISICILLKT